MKTSTSVTPARGAVPPGSATYGYRLGELARRQPTTPAVILSSADGSERRLSFEALERRSNQTARLLADRGMSESTLLIVALPNSELVPVCAFAGWKIGACVLPLNPRAPKPERQELLRAAGESGREILAVGACDDLDVDCVSVEELSAAGTHDEAPLPDVCPQPGKAICSGGSTGRPKIIVDPRPWTSKPLTDGESDLLGRRARDVALIGGPLHHNGPFLTFMCLFDGSTVVLMDRFEARRALELMERHGVTWTYLVPTQMMRIARAPEMETTDLSRLRTLFHAGSSCPEWVKRRWIDVVGASGVIEAWAMTESIGGTFIDGEEWQRNPGSVGRPAMVDLEIRDSEGNPLEVGRVGDIWMRWKPSTEAAAGPVQAKPGTGVEYEYWGSEPLPRTAEGLHRTGDLGSLDAEGFLFLADRRTDMIVTGGINVYPAEVENVLLEHPDVVDAVVVGVDDPEWGTRVHTVVQFAPGRERSLDELKTFCRERLAAHKIPKTLEVVAELPREESGKIRRSRLAHAS